MFNNSIYTITKVKIIETTEMKYDKPTVTLFNIRLFFFIGSISTESSFESGF